MSQFPREGFQDLARRLRILSLCAARFQTRRSLYKAETELGLLCWEQVDFFDNAVSAEVSKVQEFENTQAALLNTSAELSGHKAALDEELARETALHDEEQVALAAEREPIAAQLDLAETTRRQKLEAIERFDRALDELARLEKKLQTRSLALMKIGDPTMEIRAEAQSVSDELGRLPSERKLVAADKTTAAQEAARLEPGLDRLRAELQRLDATSAASRNRLAAATRRLTAQMRQLERERKKSHLHMSHLDREKRKPYQLIGACLADHGIAPLNQPEVLENVFALRERNARLGETLAALQAACAAADAGMLTAFYLLLAAILFAIALTAGHFVHH